MRQARSILEPQESAGFRQIDLTGVPVIGDSKKDLDAAKAVKAQPMLVLTGNGQATTRAPGFPKGVPTCKNLLAAAEHLLKPDESGSLDP